MCIHMSNEEEQSPEQAEMADMETIKQLNEYGKCLLYLSDDTEQGYLLC